MEKDNVVRVRKGKRRLRNRKPPLSVDTSCVTAAVADVPVWSYWTGPQPDWIGLCLDTLRRNSPTAQVLSAEYWETYGGPVPVEAIVRQRPNVQSDVLRAWLLHRYGGVWIDADAIVWRDLRPIAAWWLQYDFVAYRAAGRGGLCSALIAAPPGSMVAARYWRLVCRALERRAILPTYAIGPRLLRAAIGQVGWQRVRLLPGSLVHPIHWRRKARLWQDHTYTPPPNAWTFMLTHRSLGPLASLPRAALLDSQTLIGRLFRMGIAD